MLVTKNSWLPCKSQVGLLLAITSTSALAQTPPDADRILREVRSQPQVPSTDALAPILTPNQPAQDVPAESGEAPMQASRFDFAGNVRTIIGLIGKRGDKDAYKHDTTTATLGIRGTQFDLRVCLTDCGTLTDGSYLTVLFGSVQIANADGNLVVTAGQMAFAAQKQSPVLLPRNSVIGLTPPPMIPKLDKKATVIAAATAAMTVAKEMPVIRGAAQVALLVQQASPDAAPAITEATPADTSAVEMTAQ